MICLSEALYNCSCKRYVSSWNRIEEEENLKSTKIILNKPGLVIVGQGNQSLVNTFDIYDGLARVYSPVLSKPKWSSDIACSLLRIDDVKEVRFNDITQDIIVQKSTSCKWDDIHEQILQILLTADAAEGELGFEELEMCAHWTKDDLIVSELIKNSIQPALAAENSEIIYLGRIDNIARVKLKGTISNNELATKAIQNAVLELLTFHLPYIRDINLLQ